MMEANDVINEIAATGAVLQPWQVLVQDGHVQRVIDPDSPERAEEASDLLAHESGRVVVLYAVDARLPHPPRPGAPVDPLALGWVETQRMPALADALAQDEPMISIGMD